MARDRVSGEDGGNITPAFGEGGHNIFCLTNFCDKEYVVVHISWLRYS